MIEYRQYAGGKTVVVTTACGLCGTPLRKHQGIKDHLPSCPVREIYAERGALRDGGPETRRVQEAIEAENETAEPRALLADGGQDHHFGGGPE